MLKTYRIIPLVFILFLFGFTLITVSPVIASIIDQLIERIEKLEAAVFHGGQTVTPVEEQPTLTPVPSNGPTPKPSDATHEQVADSPVPPPWSGYTCTISGKGLPAFGPSAMAGAPMKCNECPRYGGTGNRCEVWDSNKNRIPTEEEQKRLDAESRAREASGWDPSMGMCHNSRPCMKVNSCGKPCRTEQGRLKNGWVPPID